MLQQPDSIDRYQILRELGGGGMGRVFLAHDPRFPREVALKLLHPNLASDAALRRRFQREARTIAALEHHAIVPVYDYGEHDGQLFLTMRLMRGGDLHQRLAGGPLPVPEVVAILSRVASALDKAHDQGIIHRDLKPANILFDDEGKGYLSDFGIVKETDRQTATALTGTHGVIGTPQYMSPEQALGESNIDGRSDIYALGALTYEMLSGAPPYQADTMMRVIVMHIREPVPVLSEARPDLPRAADAVLAQAMAKKREQRFRRAGAFVNALSKALEGAGGAAQEATVVDQTPIAAEKSRESGRPRWHYAAAGGATLLALAACAVLLLLLRPGAGEIPVAAADGTPTPSGTATTTASATVTPTASLTATPMGTGTPTPQSTTRSSPTPESAVASVQTETPTPGSTSPQGQIVFTCFINGVDNLCSIDADGSDQQRLTQTSATDFYASYTPDGQSILFSSRRSGEFQLYTMAANGQNARRLSPDIGSMFAPHMSPNGRQIVFANAVNDQESIWVMDADGADARALTGGAGADRDPVWSPDGRRIAFWSDRDGAGGHYVMNTDGSGIRKLPAEVAEIGGRSDWSPDGRWLAFYAGPPNDHDIYAVATDGSGQVRRLTDGGNNLAPSYSPDGAWITFTRYGSSEDPDIYIMRPDGSDLRQLTDNERPDWQPRWGP